jgi:hypothetical protein
MAFPLDTAAQNAALDALLSRDVSGIPTVWEVALFTDHPSLGGTELTSAGGYVRPTLNADLTDFPAASSGLKQSIEVAFTDATGAYSDTAPYAVLISGDDSTTRWFVFKLTEEVDVTEAGPVPPVVLTDYWNTNS